MNEELRREIIMENYLNPINKEEPKDKNYIKENSNNASCIDNIDLYILLKSGIIIDAKFTGEACAISTASTSIMIKSIIGKTINEAKTIMEQFNFMVNEKEYDSSILKEANAFDQIYKQNNRKNCALLPWIALKKVIEKEETHG